MRTAGFLLPLALLLRACFPGCGLVLRRSPTPGCNRYLGQVPPGGCRDKHVLRDLTVKGAPACLSITANNCNGGVLVLENACPADVTLAGVTLAAGQRGTWDVAFDHAQPHLRPTVGNQALFLPAQAPLSCSSAALRSVPFACASPKAAPFVHEAGGTPRPHGTISALLQQG